ncbi:M28 family peptidase [Sphingomonas sp. AX6]|uniref:M28 family peptidase n=1 Tax=Sphingomonas sp. AX6 TaxID=2653171 RepID=UPI0012F285EA|nr:M28 family peptidase [Sphingomonas sp. AX6]VXC92507.1 Zn-dependent amino-or carboxypeptidase, M28 family [Sphingomonas sp. AX6]
MRLFATALLCATALPLTALAQDTEAARVAALRDAALTDTIAWDITEGLTTEVGPRMAGTEAEARARAWSVAKLKAMGFANVRVEPFTMPVWERGEEKAEITAPFPQPLMLTALGNSGATPARGLTAEVLRFENVEALEAAPDSAVRGKIVYVTHKMTATQDGSQYGQFGAARRQGPSIASRKGAAAIIIRSIGTDYNRNPHTGVQSFAEGVKPIPAAALSIPDAEQLDRVFKRGKPVRIKLTLTPRQTGNHESGNVIAEVPGSDPNAGIVLVACHLDSWDQGTGAFDDAAGCGIVAAAAKHIMDAGQPRRTIRILWAGAEEVGIFGGDDYAKRHTGEPHAVAAESDFGADRIWQFSTSFDAVSKPVVDRLAAALAPLGIGRSAERAGGGADIGPIIRSDGVVAIDLSQDGTRYFDLHHTPNDTLDKIDLVQLRQNVAAWTAMLAITTAATEEMRASPRPN